MVPKRMFFTKGVGRHNRSYNHLNLRFVMQGSRNATLSMYPVSFRLIVKLFHEKKEFKNLKPGKSPTVSWQEIAQMSQIDW